MMNSIMPIAVTPSRFSTTLSPREARRIQPRTIGIAVKGDRHDLPLRAPEPIHGHRNQEGASPMSWLYLAVAGLFEIGWAVGLKYTDGFTRLWPSLWTVAAMAISFVLLSLALRTLPMGTAYAVWTGIGAVGTAIVGIFLLNESTDPMRLGCIGLIVAGIVGLKLASPA
jgi:quaternary ammonium compound-resistance protein SugE